MIITLKLEFATGGFHESLDSWYRLIEIEENATFETLHYAIQASVNFDNDHLYDFFIANTVRSKPDLRYDDENEDLYNIAVASIFPLKNHKKLFYLFDYGDSWYFRISKTRKKPTQIDKETTYPQIIESVGENPEQYP